MLVLVLLIFLINVRYSNATYTYKRDYQTKRNKAWVSQHSVQFSYNNNNNRGAKSVLIISGLFAISYLMGFHLMSQHIATLSIWFDLIALFALERNSHGCAAPHAITLVVWQLVFKDNSYFLSYWTELLLLPAWNPDLCACAYMSLNWFNCIASIRFAILSPYENILGLIRLSLFP